MPFNIPPSQKRPPEEARHKVVSLFSGCGGMDLGFLGGFKALNKDYKRLPFEIVWANDIDAASCETYRENIGGHIRCGDVWGAMKSLPRRADLVIGGFPCQDVSINGLGEGENGERTNLYRAMVEVVRLVRPQAFVAENVKGLLMKKHESLLRRIIADFEDVGYAVSSCLCLAADFGVPQMRERLFIVGAKREKKKFSAPAKILPSSEWITAAAAIEDLEDKGEGEAPNHVWSKAKAHGEQSGRSIVADKPSPTIRAECHGNSHFHYALPRRISMREAARFQSFPDKFIFSRGIRKIERQVGNAVPPVLAWHIADVTRKILS